MSEAREPLRKICIVGGGQVAVLAAIGFKRALPASDVVVIGASGAPQDFADHAASALPFTNKLHDRLNISEEAIVARAGGSHRLITRYFGWGDEGHHGALSYGDGGDPGLASAFVREWGAGPRNASRARPPGSLAEVLADAGRFASPPADRQTPLAELDYALRWNPPAFRALLIAEAQRLGVAYLEGRVTAGEPDGTGGLTSVAIEGHGALTADLFLDCGGSQSALVASLPEFDWQDWSEWLAPRRVLVAASGRGMLALEDRVSLLREGWLSEFAGRDGLQTTLGAAPSTNEQDIETALAGAPILDEFVIAGRVRQAWQGNVIALGDAAARFEPLAFLHLDLAHRMLSLLIEMLPGRSVEPLERAEFNRRAAMMMDGVRDTLILHYAAPRAADVFNSQTVPDSVALSVDQFVRRGRMPFFEELPLLGQERLSLMRALGYAEGVPPQALATDPRQADMARKAFEAKSRAALDFAPPYPDWMMGQLPPRQ